MFFPLFLFPFSFTTVKLSFVNREHEQVPSYEPFNLWTAANAQMAHASAAGGLRVDYPYIPDYSALIPAPSANYRPSTAARRRDSPDSYTVVGNSTVFGVIPVVFTEHHDAVDGCAASFPVYQKAEVVGSLRVSSFIPSFAGSALDSFEFSNFTFVYQNCDFDHSTPTGLSFSAIISLTANGDSLAEVSSMIQQVFGATLTGMLPPRSVSLAVSVFC